MINRKYLLSEFTGRGRRSAVNVGMVALVTSVLLCITLLAGALENAFQAPLNDIGANITVRTPDLGGNLSDAILSVFCVSSKFI